MRFKFGLIAVVAILAVTLSPTGVSAETIDFKKLANQPRLEKKQPEPKKPEPKPESPVIYTVKHGDSLLKIAKQHKTHFKSIWNKNLKIQHPDQLQPGMRLIIPQADEKTKPRPLPISSVVTTNKPTSRIIPRGAVSGNTYTYGYCTWYVKNRRPDLPNNLGNADTWYYRAKAQGIPTGLTPRVGAAAQVKGQMHVAYVEAVHGDGTITISEMNVEGWNVVSSKQVRASNYYYIY